MTFQTIFIALAIAAFSSLAITLFVVSTWSRRGKPAPAKTQVTQARRPEPAPNIEIDLAA